MTKFWIVVCAGLMLLAGCRKIDPPKQPTVNPCTNSVKKVGEFYEFDTIAGFKMRVPTQVALGTYDTLQQNECKIKSGRMSFGWENKKLVPLEMWDGGFVVGQGYKQVDVYLKLNNRKPVDPVSQKALEAKYHFRIDLPIALKNYPLVLYPKWYHPNANFVPPHPDRTYVTNMFGVLGINDLGSDYPVTVSCDTSKDLMGMSGRIFEKYAMCRGHIDFYPNGGIAMVDYFGAVAQDSDEIFKAVRSTLQSYIVKE